MTAASATVPVSPTLDVRNVLWLIAAMTFVVAPHVPRLPYWIAIFCAVVLAYVSTGGMRGTAWANTFQALLFTALGAIALFTIVGDWGGLATAFGALAAQKPELLGRQGAIAPAELATCTGGTTEMVVPKLTGESKDVGSFVKIELPKLDSKKDGVND